jgi:cell shape-determining protein MreD
MKILNYIKKYFIKNLIVFLFYFISFYSFEELRQIPNLIIFSFNLQMIIVYFYVLKFPDNLGTGHIFLAGIFNDIVIGIPLGASSLSFLLLTFFTTYIRNATLRSKMTSEWFAFIPALFFSNFSYYVVINNFSLMSFYYLELIRNTFFTFMFFPIFYYLFNSYQKKMIKENA